MTRRDKYGVAVLVALFGVLFVLLILTSKRYGSASNSYENSVIVQQRVINLQKSKQ